MGRAQRVFVVPGDGGHAHAQVAVALYNIQASGEYLAALDGQHKAHLALYGFIRIKSLRPALALEVFKRGQHPVKQGFDLFKRGLWADIHGQGLQADAAFFQALHRQVVRLAGCCDQVVQCIGVRVAYSHGYTSISLIKEDGLLQS
ncbi:hypothetical protein SDC9_201750 [bioreactor metagenome]|uniref:Uncharacterized protein n=1 Tax=bioreactor metagenome TaxID=1076179 RepID=A0A645IRR9_9ZZZZ